MTTPADIADRATFHLIDLCNQAVRETNRPAYAISARAGKHVGWISQRITGKTAMTCHDLALLCAVIGADPVVLWDKAKRSAALELGRNPFPVVRRG